MGDRKGGLVQRCVIIHRDENGYGLTVSGDNPVYVQSVRPDGAADKSGVQVSDQIIKVNGMVVTQSNHIEVVRLIKSGSFVALTLLGKDNSSKSPSTTKNPPRVSHTRSRSVGNNLNLHALPQPAQPLPSDIQNDKIQDIERNLNHEREFHHRVLGEYMRVPSKKSQQELADSQTRINALEHQLSVLTGSNPPPKATSSASRQPTPNPNWNRNPVSTRTKSLVYKSSGSASSLHAGANNFHPREGLENQSIQEQSGSLKTSSRLPSSASSPNIDCSVHNKRVKSDSIETDGPPPYKMMDKKISNDSRQVPDSSFDALFQQAKYDNLANPMPVHTAASVISMEDDEFDQEEENLEDHGPFINLIELKNKPAHLAVFLHFLFSNGDPSALFFWLVTGTYEQEQGTVKDFRRWAYEIYSTFVAAAAPLKVDIGVNEELAIEQSLDDSKTSEERFKSLFNVARSIVFTEVNEQLSDFRNRRAIGLGGLFGDHQLENDLDRQKELKVIEQTLVPHLDSLLSDIDSSNENRNERNSAMASALTTFMKQVGLGNKILGGRGNALDRVKSFAEKERSTFFIKARKGKVQVQGHQFQPAQYTQAAFCGYCGRLLWGIGPQGYQCSACEFNVHQRNCVDLLKEPCPGKGKKPDKSRPPDYPETSPEINRNRGTSVLEPDIKTRGDSRNGDDGFPDNELDRSITPTEDLRKSSSLRGQKKLSEKTLKKGTTASLPPKLNPNVPINGSPQNGNNDITTLNESDGQQWKHQKNESSDSDFDVEKEVPPWQTTVSKDIIKTLKSKEVKRQEVIHELIHTEKTHVRNLKVLNKLFYKPFMRESIIPAESTKLIFPNLEELLDVHESLLIPFKKRAAEREVIDTIGDIMVERFGGKAGEEMKETCATFCRTQKYALEHIKKLKITQKEFATFMTMKESHPLCNRLKFTDLMAKSHQRLVKYPLLLQRILDATSANHKDNLILEQSVQLSKDILNHVNDEIKEAENELRLEELQKKVEDKRTLDGTDQDEIGKVEFTKHKLIYEGDLEWRIPNFKKEMHAVLLDDLLVLLQKQDDGNKYLLKRYNVDNKVQKPVINLANIFIRDVAIDKKAFFLVSQIKSGPHFYEFAAFSEKEQRTWVEKIRNRNQNSKNLDGFTDKGRRGAIRAASPTTNKQESDESDNETSINESENEKVIEETVEVESAPRLSKERLQELTDQLIAKDEEIKKLLEEKNQILAEMSGRKYSEMISLETGSAGLEPHDIIVSAIGQATRLTDCVNEVITKRKESVTEMQQLTIGESFNSLHELLTSLVVSIQSRDNQLRTLKESSARSTIERMKTNNKSSKKPDKTSSSSSPPFDQRQPTSPKLSHQPSVPVIREETQAKDFTDNGKADIVPLKTNPFGFAKRPSDPSLDRLTPHTRSEKNVARASSFSGPSNEKNVTRNASFSGPSRKSSNES